MWVNFVAELNYRGYAKPRNLSHPNPIAIQAIWSEEAARSRS